MIDYHEAVREMYKEGFRIEVISKILNVSLDTVLEAIWGKP
jgi:transposase-like protein